ncbi:hypothetical protein NE237_025033 [Protea cynaroides]|uniref:Uncharacterized protein n=1 Tax=Protea cynaroides TaxID=273540 RepID=A0A9Q0H163_9MAGN|nr:hypothetical protein NE237_025033 [Protea cynaroides]
MHLEKFTEWFRCHLGKDKLRRFTNMDGIISHGSSTSHIAAEPMHKRGCTRAERTRKRPKTVEIPTVNINSKGQVIGPHYAEFITFLGTIARTPTIVPLNHDNWRSVPMYYKEEAMKEIELFQKGIKVTVVCPGPIETSNGTGASTSAEMGSSIQWEGLVRGRETNKICEDMDNYSTFSMLPRDISQQIFNELVYSNRLTDVSLEAFRDCALEDICLGEYPEAKDSWMEVIASQGSSLLSVDLSGSDITDSGLVLLKDCKNLQALIFNYCDQISDHGLEHISGELLGWFSQESQLTTQFTNRDEKKMHLGYKTIMAYYMYVLYVS